MDVITKQPIKYNGKLYEENTVVSVKDDVAEDLIAKGYAEAKSKAASTDDTKAAQVADVKPVPAEEPQVASSTDAEPAQVEEQAVAPAAKPRATRSKAK